MTLPNRSLSARLDFWLPAALGCLPFLGYARAQPNPGFWGLWVAVTVAMLWLGASGIRPAGWRSAVPFLGIAALLLVHLVLGLVPMPMDVLVSAGVLAIAAGLATRGAAGDAGPALRGLAWGLLAAAMLNAVAVTFERFGYEWQLVSLFRVGEPPARALGLVGQSNHLATLGMLGLVGALVLRLHGRLPRAGLWAAAAVAALLVAATSSRSGLVVAAAVFAVVVWWLRSAVAVSRREQVGLVTLFVAVQLLWVGAGASGSATGSSAPLIARADAGRLQLWHDALALWRAHPLFGVGHGNYAAGRLHDLAGPMPAPNVDHAHNLLLQVLSEWGLAGAVLAVAALGWLVWRGVRAAADPARTPDGLFAAAGIAALLAHSLAEHPLWSPYFLLPFALWVGVLARPAGGESASPAPRRGGAAMALGVVAAVAVSGFAAADYLRLQRLAAGLRADAFREAGTPQRVTFVDVARVERLTLYPRPATLLLSTVLPINEQAAEAKFVIAARAMDMVPADQTLARWALLAVFTGRADEARTLLLALRGRNPALYAGARDIIRRSTFGNVRLAEFGASLPELPR